MARYEFTLTLTGEGRTEEEAWEDACEAFAADPGLPPNPGEVIAVTYECIACGNYQNCQDEPCDVCGATDEWMEV